MRFEAEIIKIDGKPNANGRTYDEHAFDEILNSWKDNNSIKKLILDNQEVDEIVYGKVDTLINIENKLIKVKGK